VKETIIGKLVVCDPLPRVAEIAGTLISVYFEQRLQRHKLEAETTASYGQPKKPLTPRPARSVPRFRQLIPAPLRRPEPGPLQCPSDNIKADYCIASLAGFCCGVDILRVRWYQTELAIMVEMMAERGPAVAHARVMRGVQRYAPEFEGRGHRADAVAFAGNSSKLVPRGRSRASRGGSWERGAWRVKSPRKIKESVSSRRLFAPAPS
jgi:hypothetical protein